MKEANRQAVRLGFRALGPVHICQDVEVLERFAEFDYCLEDTAFLDYFESRTGLQLRWCDCCPGNRRLGACWGRKVESIAAEERWCRILRGQIQDVWEIWDRMQQEAGAACRPYEAVRYGESISFQVPVLDHSPGLRKMEQLDLF
jgi:hypothetical protein